MISPYALLIAVAIALTVYAGEQTAVGVKKVVHGVKHVAAKIVHPHRHNPEAK